MSSFFAASSTETAEANGDTRTLNFYHSHTGESIQATYRVNGSYDPGVLEKLNYFLRDWRNNDRTHMDPRLFDVVWEVYRTAGATQPIVIVSAYRSPETNAMLRSRSSAVAEHSQHILGRAIDSRMPGMSMEQIREIGMRLQRGGVGYYARENFVHLDVGGVRYWPRMSYDQLARVFPDGKSVDLAADGRALPRYEEARAEIAAHGGVASDVPIGVPGGGLFGWLFGNHEGQEAAEAARQGPRRGQTQVASLERTSAAAQPAPTTAAERRAARAAAAAAAPAVAAIEASNPPDARPGVNANRTQIASLAPQSLPPPLAQTLGLGPAPLAQTLTPPVAARDRQAGAAEAAGAPTAERDLPANPSRDAARNKAQTDKADKAAKTIFAMAPPRPPARPADLVAYADVPTPPARPDSLIRLASLTPQASPETEADAGAASLAAAKADAAGPLARAASLPVANLPAVITRGPKDQPALPATVLGYAPGATPEQAPRLRATTPSKEARPEPIVSARLDRSNYSELTSETPAAEDSAPSMLGRAFTGLRQAARIIPDAISAMPSAGYKMAFGAASSLLDYAHFIKAPPAPPPSGVSIVDAGTTPPAN